MLLSLFMTVWGSAQQEMSPNALQVESWKESVRVASTLLAGELNKAKLDETVVALYKTIGKALDMQEMYSREARHAADSEITTVLAKTKEAITQLRDIIFQLESRLRTS